VIGAPDPRAVAGCVLLRAVRSPAPATAPGTVRRVALCMLCALLLVTGPSVRAPAAQVPSAPATATTPELFGLRLGMPVAAAVRQVQALAPPGSVVLPAQRRESYSVVVIEAPADAMPAPTKPASDPRQENFYLSLNAAPRVFKNQPTRSSHTGFVTLVAEQASGRVVRVVLEPAIVRWPRGLDAEGLAADALAQRLQDRLGLPVRVVATAPAFRERPWAPRARTPEPPPPAAEVRVNAQRGSVVLTDAQRLPDALATRWELD
jgi:hypothetical protein